MGIELVTGKVTLARLYRHGVQTHVKGRSAAHDTEHGLRLELLPSTRYDGYANAQADDYRSDQTSSFQWAADVDMTLRARFSYADGDMVGTAGFGFWNAPVGVGVRTIPAPPSAVWFFFAGPNSNIATAQGMAGNGWKAASIDARNWRFLALLPTAPIAILLMRIPPLYRALWPVAERAMRVDERKLDHALREWHEYQLIWSKESVLFKIDGNDVHLCTNPPRTRMGFVAWIDNQYMVATPQGDFSQGIVPTKRTRSLEIAELRLRRR